MIDNGSFKDKKFSSDNPGSNLGNTIVNLITRQSSFVLEQTSESQGYKLNIDVVPSPDIKLVLGLPYN